MNERSANLVYDHQFRPIRQACLGTPELVPSSGDGAMPKATLRCISDVSQDGVATCVQRGRYHVTIHTWPTSDRLSRSAIAIYIGGVYSTNWESHRLPRDDAHALLIEQAKHQLGCDSLFPLMEMG